jgi:cyclomaltodextrinase / maltogenic alpha-amylase / neopullulanase
MRAMQARSRAQLSAARPAVAALFFRAHVGAPLSAAGTTRLAVAAALILCALVQAPRVLAQSAAPHWIDAAVVYGVPLPSLGPAPLAHVRAKLPELAELGLGALWLSPPFESPAGDYGYAVSDYERVRAAIGTREELRGLVDEAHRLGVRVLLDFVANHTSAEHPFFVDATRRGASSPYHRFYVRDAHGAPQHYFDWVHLPNLNYAEPAVERYIGEVLLRWVRELALDGFRFDAAWGVRERNPEVWPRLNQQLRAARPELALLAEASARDAYYLSHGFDGAYDWTEQTGRWAWQGVFDAATGIAQRLDAAVRAGARPERTLRFLNNNDTGARFVTRHGLGLTRVATAALLTLPGIPCLFYGDEVGAEFEPYEETPPRTPPRHAGLRELHRRLLALRRELPALRSAGFEVLANGRDGELYAYLRGGGAHEPPALVLLNFSSRKLQASLPLPAALRNVELRERLSGRALPRSVDRLQVALRGHGFQVWTAGRTDRTVATP